MSVERCPICGGFPSRYLVNDANLEFLKACANKGQVDEAISVARIVWSRFPELRLNADSKVIIEGVSANMLKALQVQINETLEPAKMFAEKLPELVSLATNWLKIILRLTVLNAQAKSKTIHNLKLFFCCPMLETSEN